MRKTGSRPAAQREIEKRIKIVKERGTRCAEDASHGWTDKQTDSDETGMGELE